MQSPAFVVAVSGARLGAVARRGFEVVVFVRVAMKGFSSIGLKSGWSQSRLGWGYAERVVSARREA